jgi:hypothetical protein
MTDGFELIDGDAIEGGAGSQGDLIDEPTSRRRLFKMGAVGVAAVGAAAVGNALTAGPAGAATGGGLLIGQANAASAPHDLTTLTGGSGFLATTPGSRIGVEGQALNQTSGSIGVKGTGVIGVQGVTIGGGTALSQGPGILGVGNATGVGVQARNAAGASVHTSSAIAGTHGIPAQAIGVVGNFAISGVSGALLNGFGVATIFPAGTATPATANINAGAGCFAISNSVTVGFGSGGNAGKLAIVWGGGGAVPHAQAFFDVTGYIL